MAKRGRKPAATSNSKGRPRTRSQIKPSDEPKISKSSSKNKKTVAVKNDVPSKAKNKVEKAKTKVKKTVKKSPKASKSIKSSPANKGRKTKVKNIDIVEAINLKEKEEILKDENINIPVEDDEETEDEEFVQDNSQVVTEDRSEDFSTKIEKCYEDDKKHPSQASEIIIEQSFEIPVSKATSYQFESSLEKLQQQTMAPKPFNINSQEPYLSQSLYSSITSSSTSAFSVPTQPKYNSHSPQLSTSHTDPGIANMLSNPVQSVNVLHQPLLTSSHQTLLSPPQNSNDPVHDLPPELLQQGWRKFWSRRENRTYYFNKITNESIWEMPKLSGHYDPTTDPLGINQSSNSNFHSPVMEPGTPPIYPVFNPSFAPFHQKSGDMLNNEKKAYIGPFDLDIDSNCYIWEGLVFYYFHPHPETELLRCNFVTKLRQHYYELCHTRQGIEPPKDSFTRWIMERKVIDKGGDSFLPSDCVNELSKSLFNEIMQDIPIKLVKPKFSGEARKQLSKYAEAAKKIIDSPHVSAMNRKIVKWNVEDAFEWIRKTFNATYEDYIERLEHLKKQCQPHIIEAARSSVESICVKIFHVSVDYSRRIREQNLEILKKEDLKERVPIRFSNQKKVVCYPAYLINPCPKLPPIQMFNEKDSIVLRYKNGEIVRLNLSYLQKLEILYFYNCRDDRKYNYFLTRVFCMLKRYQTFYNKTEGLFAQNALPLSVFAALNKHFGVTFECFASPLNSYFRQYCSVFPDTDGYFGSRGSILNFYPMSGSFEANPPDCEELIDASIIHFEKLLENSIEPLSFIVFIQEMPEMSQKIISKLESNRFKRMHLSIPMFEHEYRHGFQHVCNKNEVNIKSQYNTNIYFLQNDAGFLKWGPTPERVEELVESFKIGRDKELSIPSPPPTPSNIQKPENELRQNGNESKDLT